MAMAFATADAVVIGRIERVRLAGAGELLVVDVVKPLKGGVAGEVEIATGLMCYQSFSFEDFKIGEQYIFPLIAVEPSSSYIGQSLGLGEGPHSAKASDRLFTLPTCSHTALALVGEELYSNELTSDGGRRLEPYMSLPLLKFLFWAGFLSVPGLLVYVSILILSISVLVWKKAKKGTDLFSRPADK